MQTADQINLVIAIASGVSTLMSFAVVVATFKILQANRQTVDVMKEQILAITRPYVQVSPLVRVGSPFMTLKIWNSGSSAANKLKLTLDRDFFFNAQQGKDRNIRNYKAFCQQIESLPPKAEITFDLGAGHTIFGNPELCPLQFTIAAEYEFESHRVVENTSVDMRPYLHSSPPIHPVAEQIEKLNKQIASLIRKLK